MMSFLNDAQRWIEHEGVTYIKEIENNHFILIQKAEKHLIHDDNLETGIIINFKKSKTI
jgi:hypothetical protein